MSWFLGDNGSLTFWDYESGKPFQHLNDIPQSGSLDSEAVSLLSLPVLVVRPGKLIALHMLSHHQGCLLFHV